MKYASFEIFNFRGIEHLKLDLARTQSQRVFTLVGLNESGKTTILEAINEFSANPDNLDALKIQGYKVADQHSLIPVAKKSNFNGYVGIFTNVIVEEDDWHEIEKAIKKKHKLIVKRMSNTLLIEQKKEFINSQYSAEKSTNIWNYPLTVKTKQAKNWRKLKDEEFKTLVQTLKPRFPSILYFPNFLFDFPNRIYISDVPQSEDKALHDFYQLIMQDILDSLDDGLDLRTHILERAKSGEVNQNRALNSVLLQMSREVTKRILGAWGKIFRQQMSDKRVVISCSKTLAGHYFLEFKIEDSDGDFLVTERSLGFRWFFVFLLLAEYRGFRKESSKNLLFLFDEPASNLHSTAQALLLDSFSKLSENCVILYTTHSHHLINPTWLEGTFVVRNEGIDYENENENFSAKKTNITAKLYRQFASENPGKTTYFKPILDVLQWAPSNLEFVPRAIFVEGKNDFYTLNYFSFLNNSTGEIGFLPATGAGAEEPLISLYIGWARDFRILLDGDSEGEKQKSRYIKIFGDWIAKKLLLLEILIQIGKVVN